MAQPTTINETPQQRKARIKKHYSGIGAAVGGISGIYIGRLFDNFLVTLLLTIMLCVGLSAVASLIVEKKVKG